MKISGLLLLGCIVVLNTSSYSQKGLVNNKSFKSNALSLEVVGVTGSILGISYDRVIHVGNNHFWSINTGLGYFPALSSELNPIIGVPFLLDWAAGVNNSHFELGFGVTYTSGLVQEYLRDNSTGLEYNSSFDALMASFRIGYKYYRPKGGFFMRTGFYPMVKLVDFSNDYPEIVFFPMMGVSFGWSF